MSLTLSLNYGDLTNAAVQANKISNEIDQYCTDLSNKVRQKLRNAEGGMNNALDNADYYVRTKIDRLNRKAENARNIAVKLNELRDTAQRVDDLVKCRIEANQSKFFGKHPELRPSNVQLHFVKWLAGAKDTPVLGWLITGQENFVKAKKALLDNIKYWYKCEGGKETIGALLSIVEAVAAVVLLVCACVFTGGAAIVAIAGVVSATIAVVNSLANVATSFQALDAAVGGHPAQAKIYSDRNTVSDVLHETNFHDKFLNRASNVAAVAIEITDFVCSAITVIAGLPKFIKSMGKTFSAFKNGFKSFTQNFKTFFEGKKSFGLKFASIKNFVKTNFKDLLLGDLHVNDFSIFSELSFKNKVGAVKEFTKGVQSAAKAMDSLNSGDITFSEYLSQRILSRLEKTYLKKQIKDTRQNKNGEWETKFFNTDLSETLANIRKITSGSGFEKFVADKLTGGNSDFYNFSGGLAKKLDSINKSLEKLRGPQAFGYVNKKATIITNNRGYNGPGSPGNLLNLNFFDSGIFKALGFTPKESFNFNFKAKFSYVNLAA